MTKNEKIVQGVKCCVNERCDKCPYVPAGGDCVNELIKDLKDALMTMEEERE